MQARRTVGWLAPGLLAAALLLGAGTTRAGEDDAKQATKGPHLDYRRTYEAALLEARIRNVPVFVSRQKDF